MFCPAFYRHKRAVTAIEWLSRSSMLDCMGLFLRPENRFSAGRSALPQFLHPARNLTALTPFQNRSRAWAFAELIRQTFQKKRARHSADCGLPYDETSGSYSKYRSCDQSSEQRFSEKPTFLHRQNHPSYAPRSNAHH